jgi:hypothetical protein
VLPSWLRGVDCAWCSLQDASLLRFLVDMRGEDATNQQVGMRTALRQRSFPGDLQTGKGRARALGGPTTDRKLRIGSMHETRFSPRQSHDSTQFGDRSERCLKKYRGWHHLPDNCFRSAHFGRQFGLVPTASLPAPVCTGQRTPCFCD